MSDIEHLVRKYTTFNDSFKKTSYDSENDEYLCNDESQKVINFDAILEDKYPNSDDRPKSFDAIYIDGINIYCIEFKNQIPRDINNADIQGKLEQGKKELDILLSAENIQKNDYIFIYCVVYKKCTEPRDSYKCGIGKGAIKFGLEKYNNLVDHIFTNNVEFFAEQFKKKTERELAC
ncbi:hypothetical protein [Sulfurovum sp.]|uniref:hypothetical protein n=1 Tax=Sulfurovum sp. TaxID=1969726 RepID=UPI002867B4DB|nr:hypothetical protein [Sulfurovum sp.]